MDDWMNVELWPDTYSDRYDKMVAVKKMLQDWWPRTDDEHKYVLSILDRIEKYIDYLDEA